MGQRGSGGTGEVGKCLLGAPPGRHSEAPSCREKSLQGLLGLAPLRARWATHTLHPSPPHKPPALPFSPLS